jgi:hypothetical protein
VAMCEVTDSFLRTFTRSRPPSVKRQPLTCDLMDRVTVDGREEHAVPIWRTASDDGVNRSDSVSSWLRRKDSNLPPSG